MCVPSVGRDEAEFVEGESTHPDDEVPTPIFVVMKRVVYRVWLFRFIVVYLMAVAEDELINKNPAEVNLWYLIFELTSAFGKQMADWCDGVVVWLSNAVKLIHLIHNIYVHGTAFYYRLHAYS
jgi:hypothetical protein